MTFVASVKICFHKYFVFSGRAGRPEFWKFVLFLCLGMVAMTVLNTLVNGPTISESDVILRDGTGEETHSYSYTVSYSGGIFATLFGAFVLMPWISAAARRLHDIGKTAQLLWLPVIGAILASLAVRATLVDVYQDVTVFPAGTRLPEVIQEPGSPTVLFLASLTVVGSLAFVTLLLARESGPDNKYGPNPNEVPL